MGLFNSSKYNTGRSWKLDRLKFNSQESWEKPLKKRKTKYSKGGDVFKDALWANLKDTAYSIEYLGGGEYVIHLQSDCTLDEIHEKLKGANEFAVGEYAIAHPIEIVGLSGDHKKDDRMAVLVKNTTGRFDEGGPTDTIAKTILRQLGGASRLVAMVGAYNFIDLGNGLSFRLKNQKANYVKIKLNGKDLYDLEVGRVRGATYKVVESHDDVYFDMLKPLIEKSTGMYLSLAEGGGIPKNTYTDYYLVVNLDERGLYSADVYDPKDHIIFSIDSAETMNELIEGGFLKYKADEDLTGLTHYLMSMNIIPNYSEVYSEDEFQDKIADDYSDGPEEEEEEYAQGGSLKAFVKKYEKNEDINAHSENVVLLAERFGTEEELEEANSILKKHYEEGSLSFENGRKRYELQEKLMRKARAETSAEGIRFAEGGGVNVFEIWENEKYGDSSPLSDDDRQLWILGYDEGKKSNRDFYEWEEVVYGDKSALSDDDRIIWNEGNLYSKNKYAKGGRAGLTKRVGLTKNDIVILGVPRSKITEKEWESILSFAEYRSTGTFLLKDEKGLDVIPLVEYEWLVQDKYAEGGGVGEQPNARTYNGSRALTSIQKNNIEDVRTYVAPNGTNVELVAINDNDSSTGMTFAITINGMGLWATNDRQEAREYYNEEVEKYKQTYAKGGGVGSKYNTGRSWHADRAKFNKNEDWEVPMKKRGSKKGKSGKPKNMKTRYSYIPNFMIQEADIDNNGKMSNIDGANILDGIYVKAGTKYAGGGTVAAKKLLNEFDVDGLDRHERFMYDRMIKSMSKENALQVLINDVEGDYTQLSPALYELATKYEEESYAKGGGVGENEKIISYLNSMQTKEAKELKQKYDNITNSEGMYGNRPAIHAFTFDFTFDGKKYSARAEHTYTYPDFVRKYGEMPSITEMDLRKEGHAEHIESFVFTSELWNSVYSNLKKESYAKGGGVGRKIDSFNIDDYTVVTYKTKSPSNYNRFVAVYKNGEKNPYFGTTFNEASSRNEVEEWAKTRIAKGLRFENEYGTFGKGGGVKKYNYVPRHMIDSVTVERNGKETEIDGDKILDGLYVNGKAKYAGGGKVGHLIYVTSDKKQAEDYIKNKTYIERYGEDFDSVYNVQITEEPYLGFVDYRVVATKKTANRGAAKRKYVLWKSTDPGALTNRREIVADANTLRGARMIQSKLEKEGALSASDVSEYGIDEAKEKYFFMKESYSKNNIPYPPYHMIDSVTVERNGKEYPQMDRTQFEEGEYKYAEGGGVGKQEWVAVYARIDKPNARRVIRCYGNSRDEAIRDAEISRPNYGVNQQYELINIYTASGNLPMMANGGGLKNKYHVNGSIKILNENGGYDSERVNGKVIAYNEQEAEDKVVAYYENKYGTGESEMEVDLMVSKSDYAGGGGVGEIKKGDVFKIKPSADRSNSGRKAIVLEYDSNDKSFQDGAVKVTLEGRSGTYLYSPNDLVKYAGGGGVGEKRYKIFIYFGGEMPNKTTYANTIEEAITLSKQGEHSEIIDTKTNKIVEYAKGGGVNSGRDAMYRSQQPHEQKYKRKREWKEYEKQGWFGDWFDDGGGVNTEDERQEMINQHIGIDAEIHCDKLEQVLGHKPNYPYQQVGRIKLEKCYLRPYYRIC
jgi:hypothetical protein